MTRKPYLYDPAVGSAQTIDAAHGLLCFYIDNGHIAWAGGQGWNELYLYDLAGGETKKIARDVFVGNAPVKAAVALHELPVGWDRPLTKDDR